MREILKKQLSRATKEFKALPNHEEYDYFCVSAYFVQESNREIKFVMDAVAIKNAKIEELEEDDITFLGRRKVLSDQVATDLDKIFDLISYCAKQYTKQMVVFLPRQLISYHGLDGKKVLTAKDLTRIIRYSFSHNDFSLWNDEVGFRINGKKG